MERFGFVRDKLDILTLILFILNRLEKGISLEALTELALCDAGITYFDFIECLRDLTESEHIVLEDGLYTITEKGQRNGRITENGLAYSVRKLVEENTLQYTKQQRRNAMVQADISPKESGGFWVKCALSDGLGEILELKLYAATEKEAQALAKGFHKRAEAFYGQVVGLLTQEEP